MQVISGVILEHCCSFQRTGSSSVCNSTQHLHLRRLHLGTARRCSLTGRQTPRLPHRHIKTAMCISAALSTAGVQGAEVFPARLSVTDGPAF